MRMLARASLTMLCVTGAVFAAVPTAQATTAPVTNCRLIFSHDSSGETGRFCKNGRSERDHERDLSDNVGDLVGIVLDILFD